jgi:hypothetical protein
MTKRKGSAGDAERHWTSPFGRITHTSILAWHRFRHPTNKATDIFAPIQHTRSRSFLLFYIGKDSKVHSSTNALQNPTSVGEARKGPASAGHRGHTCDGVRGRPHPLPALVCVVVAAGTAPSHRHGPDRLWHKRWTVSCALRSIGSYHVEYVRRRGRRGADLVATGCGGGGSFLVANGTTTFAFWPVTRVRQAARRKIMHLLPTETQSASCAHRNMHGAVHALQFVACCRRLPIYHDINPGPTTGLRLRKVISALRLPHLQVGINFRSC